MSTTERHSESFTIDAGDDREAIVSKFAAATKRLEVNAIPGEILWDMMRLQYHEEERAEIASITQEPVYSTTYPAAVSFTVPVFSP